MKKKKKMFKHYFEESAKAFWEVLQLAFDMGLIELSFYKDDYSCM